MGRLCCSALDPTKRPAPGWRSNYASMASARCVRCWGDSMSGNASVSRLPARRMATKNLSAKQILRGRKASALFVLGWHSGNIAQIQPRRGGISFSPGRKPWVESKKVTSPFRDGTVLTRLNAPNSLAGWIFPLAGANANTSHGRATETILMMCRLND